MICSYCVILPSNQCTITEVKLVVCSIEEQVHSHVLDHIACSVDLKELMWWNY